MNRVQQLWAAGEAAAARKQWDEAASRFDAVIALEPGHVPALLKASSAHARCDHIRLSHALLMAAFAQATHHPGLVLELAKRMSQFHEAEPLLRLLEDSGFVRRADPAMLTEMALIVSALGDQAAAMPYVEQALRHDPKRWLAWYVRGTLAMFLGEIDRAEADFERSIQLNPTFSQPHRVLASLRPWTAERNHIARLQAIVARGVADPVARGHFHYALHNELHDLGRYDEAWAALEQAFAAKRAVEQYDDAATAALFEKIKRACPGDVIARTAELRDPGYTPVFILGMHRSGTTLLERILGGHSAVADGGETYAFSTQLKLASDHGFKGVIDPLALDRLVDADFAGIGAGFLRGSRWRARGKAFLTEKLPSNFIVAGLIAKALPNAKILHMLRDPMDTCFSNLRAYFANAATYSHDQGDMARFYAHYHGLMAHWREAMPGRMLEIPYDRLVDDTEATMRGVFDFCGLPFEAGALAIDRNRSAVATASSAQMRQGILKGRGGSWRAYEAHLGPMRDALAAAGLI